MYSHTQHANAHTCTHTSTHTHTCTYTNIHQHTHIHTHSMPKIKVYNTHKYLNIIAIWHAFNAVLIKPYIRVLFKIVEGFVGIPIPIPFFFWVTYTKDQ